jgi:MFS family permease
MAVDSHSKGLFTRVTLPLAMAGLINQAARTVMAVIGPVLAVEFALSASELGMLAACMLAAYALAQLPDGMALDRIGSRNVQAVLGVVTAAGFALFALAESFAMLVLARVIVGVGVSAGLMAIIKANAQWFAPSKVALVTGIAVSIGGLGSVLSTGPVAAALPALGWRGILWVLCALSAATALWIWLSVPHRRGVDPISRPSSASWARSCARRCSGASRPRSRCSRCSTSPTSGCGPGRGCATSPATTAREAPTSCSRTRSP